MYKDPLYNTQLNPNDGLLQSREKIPSHRRGIQDAELRHINVSHLLKMLIHR